MNKTSRIAAIINSQANVFQLRACFFHSTSILERRRRTSWDNASSFRSSSRNQKFNQYSKRLKKQSLLRNVGEFAEQIFQCWQSDKGEYDQSSSQGSSWFKPNFKDDGFGKKKSKNRRPRVPRREYEFCDFEDDVEFETIFRSAFGGNQYFFWSFTNKDEPQYKNSSGHSSYHRTTRGQKYHQYDEEYDSSSEFEKPVVDLASDRRALGLRASGPLNLKDVKNAYRTCALKWHPDRHQGSSKVAAEEKFKVCSAAYQSLCDKLSLYSSV